MIFKLIVNKECEESICATVHERTPLIDEVERLVSLDDAPDTVVGYEEDTIAVVRIADVELFFVENDKVYAHCGDNKFYRIKKTLSEIEQIVPNDFVRISKSGIANWSKVSLSMTTWVMRLSSSRNSFAPGRGSILAMVS